MEIVCKFDIEGRGFDIGVFDYIFLQVTLGIMGNNSAFEIIENLTEIKVLNNHTILNIIK